MTDLEKKSEILALQKKKEINTEEVKSALMNDLNNDIKIDAKVLISMADRLGTYEGLAILSDVANKMAKKSCELIQKIQSKLHSKDKKKDDDFKILNEIHSNNIELDIIMLHMNEKMKKFKEEVRERATKINMDLIDEFMNEEKAKNKKK